MTSVLLIKYISLNFACCRWTSNRKDLNIRFYKTCSYSNQMFNKSKEKSRFIGHFLAKNKIYLYLIPSYSQFYPYFWRIKLAVFIFFILLNIAKHRLTPLCKSYNFPQRCKFMKLFFECYNELVILGATINLGRRCNGYDR